MSLKSDEAKVPVTESFAVMLGNWLLEHAEEYSAYPAYSNGAVAYDQSEGHLNYTEQTSDTVHLRRHLAGTARRSFLGLVSWERTFYSYRHIGYLALAGKDAWAFKIYGKEQVVFCQRLAARLMSEFNVKITLKVVESEARPLSAPAWGSQSDW